MSRLLPALALLLAGACSQTSPIIRAPATGWANTFTAAHRSAEAGDYVRADTLLAAYAKANPGSPEAYEAIYWRGVLALDPANPHRSPVLAAGAFDEYLRSPRGQMRRGEALVLRRLAFRLEEGDLATPLSVSARRAGEAPAGDSAARKADSRDEEIAKLKEELRKTNEELERIKRRVSAPARVDPPTTPPPSP